MKPLVDCIQTTEEAIAFMRENRNSDRMIRRHLGLSGRRFKRLTRRQPDGFCPINQAWVELLVRGLRAEDAEAEEAANMDFEEQQDIRLNR